MLLSAPRLQIPPTPENADKHDIAAGEDWEQRLGRLIEAADTVVFVVSPDAMTSDRCAWEVERTVALKKRLLPIVFRRVDEALVPPRLKQLNYIFFDRPFSFVPSLQTLASALRTDVNWIRQHTRIGEVDREVFPSRLHSATRRREELVSLLLLRRLTPSIVAPLVPG